jgi:hypothetical protein
LEFGVALDRDVEETTRVKKIGHTMRKIITEQKDDATD